MPASYVAARAHRPSRGPFGLRNRHSLRGRINGLIDGIQENLKIQLWESVLMQCRLPSLPTPPAPPNPCCCPPNPHLLCP